MATTIAPLPYDLAADKVARERLARGVLGSALLLGLVGDALLYDATWGVNMMVLTLLAAALLRRLDRERGDGATRERALLLVPLVASGIALAWRDNEMLAFIATVFGVLGAALYAQALRTGPEWSLWRLDLVAPLAAAGALVRDTAGQAGLLLARDLPASTVTGGGRLREAAAGWRGLLMAVPLLLVVNALLMSADPVWSKGVERLFDFDLEFAVGNLALFGFLAWTSAGWLRGALLQPAERRTAASPGTRTLRDADVLLPMRLVNLLFAAFLAMQLRTLVGGTAYVKAVAGLTFAEYARSGFFQLITVAAIMLPALLVGDAMTPLDHRARRGFRRQAVATLLLLAAILASAGRRMALYTAEYGLTEDRLYASAIMTWLVVVLGWFALTVLRDRRERFTGGALVAAWGTWALLVVANPEAMIVRHNVARAERGLAYDARQALGMSRDAVPELVAALPRLGEGDRCIVAHAIAHQMGQQVDWREWSAADGLATLATRGREFRKAGEHRWSLEGCKVAPVTAPGR